MSEKDGGAAFPRPYSDNGGEYQRWEHAQEGMSLRDYFAGQVVEGYVHMTPAVWTNDATPEIVASIAARCYAVADAMLKARQL